VKVITNGETTPEILDMVKTPTVLFDPLRGWLNDINRNRPTVYFWQITKNCST